MTTLIKKQGFEELANYFSNDPRGKKRGSQSKNIVIPMLEINDYKYSNKKLYELSQNQGKREVFEKLYPGFIYTGHEVVFNDVDGGIYVSIKMRRLDMGNGRRYDQEYKDMIVDLFKVGMSLVEISSEYGIAKSAINGWIKEVKEIKVAEAEVIALKEMEKIKKVKIR